MRTAPASSRQSPARPSRDGDPGVRAILLAEVGLHEEAEVVARQVDEEGDRTLALAVLALRRGNVAGGEEDGDPGHDPPDQQDRPREGRVTGGTGGW